MIGLAVSFFLCLPVISAAEPRAPEPAGRPLSTLVRLLILAPDSPALHYELGAAYSRHSLWPQAEKEFQTALQLAARQPRAGLSEIELKKSYLRSVRARRPLSTELKTLLDLRRAAPSDPDIARWLVEIYLEKGDRAAARSMLNLHPSLRENADILAKIVGVGTPAALESPTLLEERFRDLSTLIEVGSVSHQTTAARQMIDLAGRLPVATMTEPRRRLVNRAFEHLKSHTESLPADDVYRFQETYLALLEQWNVRDRAKGLVADLRKNFDRARTDPALLHRLARLQAQDRQDAEALVSLREAFRLGYDDGAARLLRAEILDRGAKTAESLEEYLAALEAGLAEPDRRQAATHVERALLRLDRGAGIPDETLRRAAGLLQESPLAQLAWARRLESRGRAQEAHDRYALASRLDPSSRESTGGAARTAIDLGRESDAVAALQRMDAGQVRALWDRRPVLAVGRRLLALGETEPVRRWVQSLSGRPRTAPMPPDLIALAAELAMSEGNLEEAARQYAQPALTGRAVAATVAEQMAKIREKLKARDFAESDKLSAALRSLVHETPEAYALLGELELALGHRAAAESAFRLALTARPNNEEAALGLARLLEQSGDAGRSIEALTKLDPKSKEVCRALARLHAGRAEWEMAAGWMEKCAEADQDRMQTAWYWFRAGQIDEAFQLVPRGGLFEAVLEAERGRTERLAKLNPRLLRTVLGEPERPEGRRKKIQEEWNESILSAARRRFAADDHEALIDLCDDLLRRADAPEAHYLKGAAYLKLGLYDLARESLRTAAKFPDWSVPANLKLGQLALILGEPLRALAHLDKAGPGSDPSELILAWGMALAVSKSPEQGEQIVRQVSAKTPRGKFFLGRLLENQGRAKEAVEAYRSALRDHGEFAPAAYRLGLLAKAAKDARGARDYFSAILRDAPPGDPYRQLAQASLEELDNR
ncbi:MAG: hypothetical protein A3G34_01010 [Candidatus Lindowbacteria bacterium RIFCSPLOWO2_12_FULL_62_27]|nr:MAG: hypothetical protein A3G34_01010 [Candidatus Lindowbacteria bacterium RIFCSPLOWO2_12_FULL_62_27]